ncbi:Phospholipase YtpA [Sedimentisphaera cyanobacteriorum]|uniref:Phospholipase YtpA n=1 Tax=Sedimentisphaera cyanobacteriorum TaxID=1940790 RepID=A0A1Q2HNS8_9BACT|nr:alpha/beta hydrolase [Sedimentisphaera cyanobacteriorum]AQQ08895.1 Phospholipase YtpA [Sedimentisphaera cyanobacteriorum]
MKQHIIEHLRYYHLPAENTEFEYFPAAGFNIASYLFPSQSPKAVIIALHGYLGHCVQMGKLIPEANNEGYSVAALDLPGHGLSSGEKYSISSFDKYREVLEAFAEQVKIRFPEIPVYGLGFSLGGAIFVDYHLKNGKGVFEKTVLAAPLIRNALWEITKKATMAFDEITDKIPRVYKKETSDPFYIEMERKDPLRANFLPLRWVKALHSWEADLREKGKCSVPARVLYGLKDTTVDTKEGTEYFKNYWPNAEIIEYPGGKHELILEAAPLGSRVIQDILTGLKQ